MRLLSAPPPSAVPTGIARAESECTEGVLALARGDLHSACTHFSTAVDSDAQNLVGLVALRSLYQQEPACIPTPTDVQPLAPLMERAKSVHSVERFRAAAEAWFQRAATALPRTLATDAAYQASLHPSSASGDGGGGGGGGGGSSSDGAPVADGSAAGVDGATAADDRTDASIAATRPRRSIRRSLVATGAGQGGRSSRSRRAGSDTEDNVDGDVIGSEVAALVLLWGLYLDAVAGRHGRAAHVYRAAMDLGSDHAQYYFAALCEGGQGVKHDPAKAVEAYQASAGRGCVPAISRVAFLLMSGGLGLEVDNAKGLEMYKLAAARGRAAGPCVRVCACVCCRFKCVSWCWRSWKWEGALENGCGEPTWRAAC